MNKNILSIETTTNICSVSLFSNDNLISIKEDYNRNHSSLLGKYIDEIFYSQKIKLIDLDAIALSIGPGSYTGLRIGLSMAKGLAYTLEKPLIPIDTIESINISVEDKDYYIVVPAYKEFCFVQEYRNGDKVDGIKFKNIDDIKSKVNIYGYLEKDFDIKINQILPSSKNIYKVAYEYFNEYICYDIKSIKPNYVKPIKYKEIKSSK